MRSPPSALTLVVARTDPPGRLDAWIAAHLPDCSRRQARRMLDSGLVRVNGRAAGKACLLHPGDAVEIEAPPPGRRWVPEPDGSLPLFTALVDPLFIVLDKPAGLPTTPLRPGEIGTLAGALVARHPECSGIGRAPGDGGLLQRLDAGTSGLLVAARTPAAFDRLRSAQDRGEMEKRYLALVETRGTILDEVVEAPLAPRGPGRREMGVSPDGRPARTAVATVDTFGRWSLVSATIHRGARHQIRAHLAHIGAPIAGDELYGGASPDGLGRLFLHCAGLSFPHPDGSGRTVACASPIPSELAAVLARLNA